VKNVVLIVSDQHRADAYGYIDNSYKTPNIDWLVSNGICFTKATCSLAQCTPSRASMVTGLYPHQVGVRQIGHCLSDRYHTVAKEFKKNGYQTAHFGKWHLYSKLEDHGYDLIDYDDEGLTLEDVKSNNEKEDVKRTARAVNYIRNSDENKPFFLTLSLINPHPPFENIKPFDELYKESDAKVPYSFNADDLSTKPVWQSERAKKGESNINEEIIRDDNLKYRSMVSFVDWCVGNVLKMLKEKNLMENTVIAFTSDHGDMQGAHKLRFKGVVPYREIYDIPYIFYVPGLIPKRKVVDDLVVNTSLPGTLLEAAGLAVPACFEGGSVLSCAQKEFAPDDEEVFFEHWRAYWAIHPLRGVKTRKWKYVFYFQDDFEEMYDLESDPDECNNIAYKKELESTKQELRLKVDQWWEETGALSVEPINARVCESEDKLQADGRSDFISGEWAKLL